MTPLNVIALISGGKDSLFSILHCMAAGHKIVALANIHPPGDSTEDVESHMYQTVGHDVIPLYAEALNLPLFRKQILGNAVVTAREYTVPKSGEGYDETETLAPLFRKVMKDHPEADAVSTGAILSTYQRTRVESVALRFGLTPLAFLWQYPFLPPYRQSQLLLDMGAMGMDARVIKVASGGLDNSILGHNVASIDIIEYLKRAASTFGQAGDGAVVGEGGEYETLCVDGPSVLWKKTLAIGGSRPMQLDAQVGIMSFKNTNAKAIDKEDDGRGLETLRIPPLWDDDFKVHFDALGSLPSAKLPGKLAELRRRTVTTFRLEEPKKGHLYWTFSNAMESNVDTAAEQLRSIMTRGRMSLYLGRETVHATLLLRSMSDFEAVNKIYRERFTDPIPPTRVTVALGDAMPEGIDIMLSVINVHNDKIGSLSGLHVQSRSYWAPANIGPYSQAISGPLGLDKTGTEPPPALLNIGWRPPFVADDDANANAVYVAGQIPLVPSTMELYTEKGFAGQGLLAMQHLWRIGRTMNVKWWNAGVAFISRSSTEEPQNRVAIAQVLWKTMHDSTLQAQESQNEDALDIDPWDLQNRVYDQCDNDKAPQAPIPDRSVLMDEKSFHIPPAFVVEVEELPRGADIEWHSIGVAVEDCDILTGDGFGIIVYTVSVPAARATLFAAEFTVKDDGILDRTKELVEKEGFKWEHATLYAAPECHKMWSQVIPGTQWIPCHRVWGKDGEEVAGVIVGRASW
ncbi:adenine nucleotide alpha hydrolases-like protein [Lojkania enalia]|uniref:Diphthine--ammonia ligase n=1 Tax=Lojkania enalia TaxID=147567 RepID=A0A9P4KBN8_9PLEO|nr:adenine nucleotide alpha hydrolases-like protein [Didymosphaeria enalia]